MKVKVKKPKKWIQGMHMKEGAETAQAKAAGMSPMAFAEAHKHSPGKTGKRATLALTFKSFRKK